MIMEIKCFFCGSELIWGSDFNLEEVCDPPEEERKTSYKEYWNED